MKTPKKKPVMHELTIRGKFFVAGTFTAFAILAIGLPVASWLGWKAHVAQKLCDAQIQENTVSIAKGTHVPGDKIPNATLGRITAQYSSSCQAASKANQMFNNFLYWVIPFASVIVLISLMPGFFSVLRWVVKRYQDYMLWR